MLDKLMGYLNSALEALKKAVSLKKDAEAKIKEIKDTADELKK